MRYFAALVLLLSLAAANAAPAADDKKKGGDKGGDKGHTGGGKGDPIMTSFTGRKFEFFGKAGTTYNVLSEKSHQVSMKLKEGVMWDHVGTYMEAIGFMYNEHTVSIAQEGDSLQVTLDGEAVTLREGETEAEHLLGLAQGELQLLWQLHRPDYGNTVELTTDLLSLLVWITPAGTRDEGGKVQPAYLNFDVTLLASPAHNAIEGIIGESFAKAMSGVAEEDDFAFHGVEASYEMASLYDQAHPKCMYGKASPKAGNLVRARKLIETHTSIVFPLKASFA